MAKWRCTICNYIYDEDKKNVRFEELPSDWACPMCSASKSAFVLMD
jgi:pyruvate oxidase/acetolactate synthase-1/2/3 large subunit